MSAFVEHQFAKGFLLGEEQLRKLQELIQVRLGSLPNNPHLSFRVCRGDSFSYVTNDIHQVLAEENSDWRAITRLELLVNEPNYLEFKLLFSSEGAALEITGDSRDAVFLLFADLREYMHNEVMIRRVFSRDSARLVALVVSMSAMFISLAYMTSSLAPDPSLLAEAIKSVDPLEKLNFLLQRNSKDAVPSWRFLSIFAAAMVLSVFINTGAVRKVFKNIYSSNEFIFGRRKMDLEKKQKFWSNIFWVVVVGGVISIATGWLVK